jgi:hypothetical protein
VAERHIISALPYLFHTIWNFPFYGFLCTRLDALCNDICHMQFNLLLSDPPMISFPHNNSSSTTNLYQLFCWKGTMLVPYGTTPLHELCDCTSYVLRAVALAAFNHDDFFHLSVLSLTYPFVFPTAINPICVECLTWKLASRFCFGFEILNYGLAWVGLGMQRTWSL